LNDEKVLRKSRILFSKPDVSKLSIARLFLNYEVLYGDEVRIGMVQRRITEALRILEGFPTVEQEIKVDPNDFEDCIRTWKDKGKAADFNLEINLYGPLDAKEAIGKMLSDARIFLQQPRSIPDGTIIDNPHMIDFPKLLIDPKKDMELNPTLTALEKIDARNTDVLEVLEGCDQGGYLDMAQISSCVTSTLLE
jgi:hypothetical protein